MAQFALFDRSRDSARLKLPVSSMNTLWTSLLMFIELFLAPLPKGPLLFIPGTFRISVPWCLDAKWPNPSLRQALEGRPAQLGGVNGTPTQKTLDSVFECRLLLRGFIERPVKADGRVRSDPLKNGRLLSGEGLPNAMHVRRTGPWCADSLDLAAACPQCRSTTMVVTNQDDRWLGEKTTPSTAVSAAAGLTGDWRTRQWHGFEGVWQTLRSWRGWGRNPTLPPQCRLCSDHPASRFETRRSIGVYNQAVGLRIFSEQDRSIPKGRPGTFRMAAAGSAHYRRGERSAPGLSKTAVC